MRGPYGLELVEDCKACHMRQDGFFCQLPCAAVEKLNSAKFTSAHPAGAVLFVEGQLPKGVYMLCKGRVKLTMNSADGKTLIVRIGEPGEILGLHATLS